LTVFRRAVIAGIVLLSASAYAAQPDSAQGSHRVLYYRSQMGPETSPVPKQDDMGMDYLPVYEESAKPPHHRRPRSAASCSIARQ
jgi:hypothetical protein